MIVFDTIPESFVWLAGVVSGRGRVETFDMGTTYVMRLRISSKDPQMLGECKAIFPRFSVTKSSSGFEIRSAKRQTILDLALIIWPWLPNSKRAEFIEAFKGFNDNRSKNLNVVFPAIDLRRFPLATRSEAKA